MIERRARCACGQLEATCTGEPVRISVCHCLDCQRRTGSAFAAQARFPVADVVIGGTWRTFERRADSGRRAFFRFCPECGSTVAYTIEGADDVVAVPLGAFADPGFPPPRFSVYEARRHGWITLTGDVEHSD